MPFDKEPEDKTKLGASQVEVFCKLASSIGQRGPSGRVSVGWTQAYRHPKMAVENA